MVRVFSGKKIAISTFVFFVAMLLPIISSGSVNAGADDDYVKADGANPAGGSCGTYRTDAYWWDTCYGLSWQYYEWPKDANGNPMDGRLSFWCGHDNNADNSIGCTTNELTRDDIAYYVENYNGRRSRRIIIDPDATRQTSGSICKNTGGFWFLGYQVYSPVNATNHLSLDAISWQVGRPSVEMLDSYVNIGTTSAGARLYPFGRNGLVNSAVNPNVDTHTTLYNKGYRPAICNSWNCTKNAFSDTIQPRIDYGTNFGSYKMVTAKYYASTQEVYNHWLNVAPEGENFQKINWFCAGSPDLSTAVYGSVKATMDSSSQQTSWDESNTAVSLGTVQVTQGESKTVTFRHYIKDKGYTKYNISKTDSLARSKDNVTNAQYTPRASGDEQIVMSRTATLSYDNVSNGQEICDVLTYNDGNGGSHTRKACVTIKKQTDLTGNGSYSSVKKHDATSWTKDETANDNKAATVTIPVVVSSDSASVDIDFEHHITASYANHGLGKASVPWSVSQTGTATTLSTSVTSGTQDVTISAVNATDDKKVANSTVRVSGITSATDTTICQTLVTSYKTSRTTTVCARIIGSSFSSSSVVKQKDSSDGWKTSITINKTVMPGSTGSVTLTFLHQVGLAAGAGSQSGNITYSVSQNPNDNASVTKFTAVSNQSISVTTSAQNAIAWKNASGPTDITVSGINKNTNITVCQTMVASYGGNKTTTACATVKGRENAVTGRSSVGATESANEEDTGFVTVAPSTTPTASYNIFTPYDSTYSKTVYFKHDVKGALGTDAENLGDITYTIYRGGTAVDNYSNKKVSFSSTTGSNGYQVYKASTSVTAGSTVCQTLDFSYGTISGAPKACAKVTGVRPTVKGSSAVSAAGKTKVTQSENNKTSYLEDIVVRVALGKSTTKTVNFSHTATATSSEVGALGKTTGNIPYKIQNKDGGNIENSTWSKTFPSSFTSGTVTASKDFPHDETYTVTPTSDETRCQTLVIDGNVWKTTVCARVLGELSMPTVESRSGVSRFENKNFVYSDWATKTNSTAVKDDDMPVITQGMLESTSNNGGVNVKVYFKHNIQTIINELSEQTTGDVSYSIITTGANDNSTKTGSFNHTVKDSTVNPALKNMSETIPSSGAFMREVNVVIGTNTTVCQELRFTYDGSTFSSKACAKVKGITAKPYGKSRVQVVGYTPVAETSWEHDGEIATVTAYDVNLSTIKGSDIRFNHALKANGEWVIDVPFSIQNDCPVNAENTNPENGVCKQDYSAYKNSQGEDLNFHYDGSLPSSGAEVWAYIINDVYTRPRAISDQDAKAMVNRGRVCETLEYLYDGVKYRSTACAIFVKRSPEYNVCPDLMTLGTTSSTTYVKKFRANSETSDTPDHTTVVYAKPTDNVVFTHCYYPGAQATRYTSDDESLYNNPSNNGKIVWIPTANAYVEDKNEFTIRNADGTETYISNKFEFTNYDQIMIKTGIDDNRGAKFVGVVGNASKTSVETNKRAMTAAAVGNTLTQSLYDHPGTNSVSGHSTANCGSGCTVTYRNRADNNWYNITSKTTDKDVSVSSYAQVIVPYNYETTAEIQKGTDTIYAGEGISGNKVQIHVKKRTNGKVGDTYATKTDESVVKLYMFYGTSDNNNEGSDHTEGGSNVNGCNYYNNSLRYNNCSELDTADGKSNTGLVFNPTSNPNGDDPMLDIFKPTYNVPDLPAGSKVCMGVSVYPAASTDTEPSNGQTFVSKAYCRTVAKKPSFQVWGGSVFSAGNVLAFQATKYTIAGVYDYTVNRASDAPSITFGSWVEQGITANGTIRGVSSGAGLGYGAQGLVVNAEHPGGNSNSNFCNLSRLTFSNQNCATGTAGNFGATGDTATKNHLKQDFAKVAAGKGANYNTGSGWVSLDLSNSGNYVEENSTRYTYATGNLALSASQALGAGVTHVIYTTGNVIINGNLIYNNNGYQNIEQVPQYIIVTDGSIYIGKDVTRVDAILLAERTINTCASLSGNTLTQASKGSDNVIKDLYCGKQLRINGAIVAGNIKLYRIHGASVGLDSSTPAEIINFSPTLFMWDFKNAISEPHVSTSYQRELAPRQ